MRTADMPSAITTTRVDALRYFLDRVGVSYELIGHRRVTSAHGEAVATHQPPDQVAKTVVLQDGGVPVIVIIPASGRLDLHKLSVLLNAAHRLELATEDQIAHDFPLLAVGAIPPFGPRVLTAEVMDRRLLENDRILCPAGDNRYSLLVDPHDVLRITGAKVADISQD